MQKKYGIYIGNRLTGIVFGSLTTVAKEYLRLVKQQTDNQLTSIVEVKKCPNRECIDGIEANMVYECQCWYCEGHGFVQVIR